MSWLESSAPKLLRLQALLQEFSERRNLPSSCLGDQMALLVSLQEWRMPWPGAMQQQVSEEEEPGGSPKNGLLMGPQGLLVPVSVVEV
mmetsp:Transcript_23149/g.52038  ORF Transcript_23149/g.52038 Transcript_23149/m.52038 type:complete len:88 (+) Transcript_23149:161-424(+)